MRRVVQAVVLGLALMVLAPAIAVAGGNANFIIGEREMNVEWHPVENQPMFGAAVDWGMDDWPIRLAWGLNVSVDSPDEYWDREYSASLAEVSFGLLWLPIRDRSFRPYVGAGIATVFADVEISPGEANRTHDIDDYAFGYYLNAGIYWRLGSRFNLGLDLRHGYGTTFDGTITEPLGAYRREYTLEGGYLAYSLLFGFGWGD